MKTRFFETGLVMAAVCCLLSCYGGQDNGLNGVRFENYASMKEVVEGKALDRSKFVLPPVPKVSARNFTLKKQSVLTMPKTMTASMPKHALPPFMREASALRLTVTRAILMPKGWK